MTFDDYLACYCTLRNQLDNEISQIMFELVYIRTWCRILVARNSNADELPIRLSEKEEAITYADLFTFASDLVDNEDYYVRMIFKKMRMDINKPVKREDFAISFDFFKDNPLFSWIQTISNGFAHTHLNIKDDIGKGLARSLTAYQNERTTTDAINSGLSQIEIANIKDFFEIHVKGRDGNYVMTLFKRMFKDIKNSKLKKYFMNSVSQVSGLTLAFMCNMVLNVCKKNDRGEKL